MNFWQNRSVFVTGCTGLLGSWLTAELVAQGADVVGLVRDQVPHSELVLSGTIEKIRVAQGDVVDFLAMERILAEYEVDTIFHLAAQTIVGIANRAPLSTFETNVRGTWNVLEAARRIPTVRAVVVASSDKAYGSQETMPYREEAPLAGKHPYDVSKSCADLIAQAYAHSYHMGVVVTRCANLYGGGDLNWSRIIPGTIRSVLRGERPIIRSDGKFERDYLYVKDAVQGYLLAARCASEEGVRGQAFNFGLQEPITALHMVETLIALSDHPALEPLVLDEARNEIPIQYLAADKAHRLLGWEPAYSLEQGVAETLSWYRHYLSSLA